MGSRWSLGALSAGLVLTFLGLITNLLLVIGAKTERRFLLLPWLVYHVLFVLACLGGGLYLALHFTVLAEEEEDYVSAVASLFPIVFGIFFIFVWILVDQLFIKLKHKKRLSEVVASRRASLASIHSMYNGPPPPPLGPPHHGGGAAATDTMRSNTSRRSGKTVRAVKRGQKHNSLKRSRSSVRGAGGGGGGSVKAYQIRQFSCRLDIPKVKKSRSLEQILDSSGGSASSSSISVPSYSDRLAGGLVTLPRLSSAAARHPPYAAAAADATLGRRPASSAGRKVSPRSETLPRKNRGKKGEQPGAAAGGPPTYTLPRKPRRAAAAASAAPRSSTLPRRELTDSPMTDKLARRRVTYMSEGTDTMRSCKSLASAKSVTIHPEVTEYRYRNGGRGGGGGGGGRAYGYEDEAERLQRFEQYSPYYEGFFVTQQQQQQQRQEEQEEEAASRRRVVESPPYPQLDRHVPIDAFAEPVGGAANSLHTSSVNIYITGDPPPPAPTDSSSPPRLPPGGHVSNPFVNGLPPPPPAVDSTLGPDARLNSALMSSTATAAAAAAAAAGSPSNPGDPYKVPPPVYPTLPLNKDWRHKLSPNKVKGFTKDQIIDFYCQPTTATGDVYL